MAEAAVCSPGQVFEVQTKKLDNKLIEAIGFFQVAMRIRGQKPQDRSCVGAHA